MKLCQGIFGVDTTQFVRSFQQADIACIGKSAEAFGTDGAGHGTHNRVQGEQGTGDA